jgi:hypothetical protein
LDAARGFGGDPAIDDLTTPHNDGLEQEAEQDVRQQGQPGRRLGHGFPISRYPLILRRIAASVGVPDHGGLAFIGS